MKLYRCVFFALLAYPLAAQMNVTEPAPSEGITRRQADEILNELRQIRQLLQRQQAGQAADAREQDAPKRAKLTLRKDAPMLGSKDAPLTIVEYTDYQCPFCQRFHAMTFPELKKNYIDTGKVRFFSKDMPLDFHANAMRAAQAGRCAADQGQFWKMRDVMANSPSKLDMESLVDYAGRLEMDAKVFRECVESEKYKTAVQTDVMEAMKIGADGTPSFVVGKSTPDGVDGELVVGALPYAMFDQKLQELVGAQ